MSNTIYSITAPEISSDDQITKKYNYTYRITEISTGMQYIGVRSSSIDPIYDIGVKYFSSSSNKEFIKNQKQNRSDYLYEVICIFYSRDEANMHEIYLHNLYNVHINENYINRSKSTSSKFLCNNFNKVVVVDKDGNFLSVYKTDIRYLSGELKHVIDGCITVKDIHGNTMSVDINDPRYLSGELVGVKAGTVTVVDSYGNYQTVSVDDAQYLAGELVHNTKNRVTVKDIHGNTMSVEKTDPRYLSGELVGHSKGTHLSDETKQKMSKSLKGSKSGPIKKPVSINGIIYDSLVSASKSLDQTCKYIRNRCRNDKFTDWFYIT